MKKIALLFLFLSCAICLYGQHDFKAFPDLDSLNVKGGGKIFFVKSKTTIYNIKIADLPKNDPMYSDEFEADNQLAIKTKIDNTDNYYYIVFTEGPSFDLGFEFYTQNKQYLDNVPGSALYIPGNGFVYSAGHNNNTFYQRRKYAISDNKFKEIVQPYYYVGLKTKTLKPIVLYSDKNLRHIVAELTGNEDVEVLLAEKIEKNSTVLMYLLRTPFGLCGWTKLNGLQYHSDEVEGIFYKGD